MEDVGSDRFVDVAMRESLPEGFKDAVKSVRFQELVGLVKGWQGGSVIQQSDGLLGVSGWVAGVVAELLSHHTTERANPRPCASD